MSCLSVPLLLGIRPSIPDIEHIGLDLQIPRLQHDAVTTNIARLCLSDGLDFMDSGWLFAIGKNHQPRSNDGAESRETLFPRLGGEQGSPHRGQCHHGHKAFEDLLKVGHD